MLTFLKMVLLGSSSEMTTLLHSESGGSASRQSNNGVVHICAFIVATALSVLILPDINYGDGIGKHVDTWVVICLALVGLLGLYIARFRGKFGDSVSCTISVRREYNIRSVCLVLMYLFTWWFTIFLDAYFRFGVIQP